MTMAGIISLQQALALSSAAITGAYGAKFAGLIGLETARAASPFPYTVGADGKVLGVPARTQGDFSTRQLRASYDELISGRKQPAVLMARSSSLTERPGKNPTEMVVVRGERTTEFLKFKKAFDVVYETSDDMGVVLMPAVGAVSRLANGAEVFGATNLSFVLDSHDPIHTANIHMALVHGFGTRVVEANDEFMPIIADRATSKILFFGNRGDGMVTGVSQGSTVPIDDVSEYRQRKLDCIDLREGKRISWPLSRQFVQQLKDMVIQQGRLFSLSDSPYGDYEINLGCCPIGDPRMLERLFGIVNYLSATRGPVLLEGAWSDSRSLVRSLVPSLYQLDDVPAISLTPQSLTIPESGRITNKVLGQTDFTGPLVVITIPKNSPFFGHERFLTELKRLDEQYGLNGYALLAKHHAPKIIEATPNCRIRLSLDYENVSSHAFYWTRLKLSEDPQSGYVLAIGVQFSGENLPKPLAQRWHNSPQVVEKVHIESDGKEMRLQVLQAEPEVGRWVRFLRWVGGEE